MKSTVISVDSEVMSGTPCFADTRVPVRTLFDYLEGGHPLADFFEDFPTVTQQQVKTLLEEAKEHCLATAH